MKNIRHLIYLIFILTIFFLFTSHVSAGGGRIMINTTALTIYTGTNGVAVSATVYRSDYSQYNNGEKLEFQIKNPRDGDRCVTTNNTVNDRGQISGSCYATQAGTVTIFVHSIDNGDNSSDYLLDFISQPPTPTPTRVPIPTRSTSSGSLTSTPIPTKEIMNNKSITNTDSQKTPTPFVSQKAEHTTSSASSNEPIIIPTETYSIPTNPIIHPMLGTLTLRDIYPYIMILSFIMILTVAYLLFRLRKKLLKKTIVPEVPSPKPTEESKTKTKTGKV